MTKMFGHGLEEREKTHVRRVGENPRGNPVEWNCRHLHWNEEKRVSVYEEEGVRLEEYPEVGLQFHSTTRKNDLRGPETVHEPLVHQHVDVWDKDLCTEGRGTPCHGSS